MSDFTAADLSREYSFDEKRRAQKTPSSLFINLYLDDMLYKMISNSHPKS